MSILIFDIETVPDYSLWTPPPVEPPVDAAAAPTTEPSTAVGPHTALVDQKKARKSRARKPADPNKPLREPMPPLYACRPVSIAMMMLRDDLRFENAGVFGAQTYHSTEPDLLRMFSEFLYTNMPALVTFGGRHFEMPVMSLRGLRHGVAMKWMTPQVRHRYGEEHHIDLCDTLTEFGAVNKTGYTLDALSQLCGLPPKTTAGDDVLGLFKSGEFAKIDGYCLTDVFRTTILYLRHRVMRGFLQLSEYREIVADLMARATAWNLGSVTFGVDSQRLMLEG